MVRVTPRQHATSAGEVSTQIHGRPDFARYQAGVELMRGFIPLAEGVATRTPGTRFLGETYNRREGRLLPAILFDRDNYMIEMTNTALRFWRQRALIQQAGSPYRIGSPYLTADLPNIQFVPSGDKLFLVDGDKHPRVFTRIAEDEWTVANTPFREGPFLTQNLDTGLTVQSDGTSGFVFLQANFDFFKQSDVGTWIALGEIDGDKVNEWEPGQSVSSGDARRSDGHVYSVVSGSNTGTVRPIHTDGIRNAGGGIRWRYRHSGWGFAQIREVINRFRAEVRVYGRLPYTVEDEGTYRWRQGAWSEVRGFPSAIAQVDQRFVYAGTPTEPLKLYFSTIGNTELFRPSILADEAFSYALTPPRRRQSRVRWIEQAGKEIHVGTASGELVGRSSDASLGFTAETVRFDPGTTTGCNGVQPVLVDGDPVFLTPDGLSLVGLKFVFERDRVEADPLTIASRHVLYPGGVWLAWQQRPYRILWIGLKNGEVASLTYEPDHSVFAWARHWFGGKAEWGAVKPTDDDTSEELWLIVNRTIQGQARRYVELVEDPFGLHNPPDDPPEMQDAWHLMGAVRYQGAETTRITGLDHLEGEEVWAWTEHGAQGPYTVLYGEIELERAATSATTGVDASDRQRLRYLDQGQGAADGSADGRNKVVRGSALRVLNTAGGTSRVLSINDRLERQDSAPQRLLRAHDHRRSGVELYSGPVDIDPKSGWGPQQQIEIQPEPGAPLTVAGQAPTIFIADS